MSGSVPSSPPSGSATELAFETIAHAFRELHGGASEATGGTGIEHGATFHTPGIHPFDEIEWQHRTAAIAGRDGHVVFEQRNVEVPAAWSQLATNVVASKYFRGRLGTPEREHSIKQLIERVAGTITEAGIEQGSFADESSARAFYGDLAWLLLHQRASFNSPVWFNVGVEAKPQCAACFINSVEDTLESILELAKTEGMLFKFGSGAGVNLSSIRSSREPLSSGGVASGPVSFMRGYDAFAAAIKSGGKTRRAAKMQILDAEHPDLLPFIDAKANEERKAWALIEHGYGAGFEGEAYQSVAFQNANLSVRLPDRFMRALERDEPWELKAVHVPPGAERPTLETVPAREIMRRIAEACWVCGDPGIQFEDTIQAYNPVRNSGRIRGSNPCSEFLFLDDTACNLASLNVLAFERHGGRFDVEGFRRAARVLIIAQEILVEHAGYPTEAIRRNSHEFRPLGLGFANLGAWLMSRGLAYDSDTGREHAAALAALLAGEAYRTSAEFAREHGPFAHFQENREPFLEVIEKHRANAHQLAATIHDAGHRVEPGLLESASQCWDDALELGRNVGFRNAQTTVIAPTGTIAFMMDCATTGIEPELALIKQKRLVGGGSLKLVNPVVPTALASLGYNEAAIQEIQRYLEEQETIEGAPQLKEEHLAVFDCAYAPRNGVRSIATRGHLEMVAAVQPFISGAISKTINVPQHTSVEEIERSYRDAWELGLKAVSIYRDGSKRTQPLHTGAAEAADVPSTRELARRAKSAAPATRYPYRRHMPEERRSITHKFRIGGHEGYLTVGLFPDGTPGEIFVRMAKQGSFVSGLMDAFATATSIMLQYGVPLRVLVDKFAHTRFEPDGLTGHREIPFARSVLDYIFRWLAWKFVEPSGEPPSEWEHDEGPTPASPVLHARDSNEPRGTGESEENRRGANETLPPFRAPLDAPPCPVCGTLMLRLATCYQCDNCGYQQGCT